MCRLELDLPGRENLLKGKDHILELTSSDLHEEANCTEPFPSASVPCTKLKQEESPKYYKYQNFDPGIVQ